MSKRTQVTIIGAGPAGAVAAALLCRLGVEVSVVERDRFPRFSIGESLLPQCMTFLAEAGLEHAVHAAGFQFKDGAVFDRNRGRATEFDFTDKFSPGPGTTYQVERARFDQLLADAAAAQGATFAYGHQVQQVTLGKDRVTLRIVTDAGEIYNQDSAFVLDASGFGRVLPRLLQLERPSRFPVRRSVFTHVRDGIAADNYDRDKILISVHPQQPDTWFWLIPFADGRASIGVVARDDAIDASDPAAALRQKIAETPNMSTLLARAEYDSPVRSLAGYACDVTSLHGPRFALLGNAGEFLDPVFSSGVTIAMKSASLAAPLVSRFLQGEAVAWERDYAQPLKRGVDTFRTFVNAWYDGSFQDVIFFDQARATPAIRRMISSILAGYAWDTNNPFVAESDRRLRALVELCRAS